MLHARMPGAAGSCATCRALCAACHCLWRELYLLFTYAVPEPRQPRAPATSTPTRTSPRLLILFRAVARRGPPSPRRFPPDRCTCGERLRHAVTHHHSWHRARRSRCQGDPSCPKPSLSSGPAVRPVHRRTPTRQEAVRARLRHAHGQLEPEHAAGHAPEVTASASLLSAPGRASHWRTTASVERSTRVRTRPGAHRTVRALRALVHRAVGADVEDVRVLGVDRQGDNTFRLKLASVRRCRQLRLSSPAAWTVSLTCPGPGSPGRRGPGLTYRAACRPFGVRGPACARGRRRAICAGKRRAPARSRGPRATHGAREAVGLRGGPDAGPHWQPDTPWAVPGPCMPCTKRPSSATCPPPPGWAW